MFNFLARPPSISEMQEFKERKDPAVPLLLATSSSLSKFLQLEVQAFVVDLNNTRNFNCMRRFATIYRGKYHSVLVLE